MVGKPVPQPVDGTVDAAPQNRGGKRVEVVLAGEQENHCDPLEQRAVDRSRQEFTGGQFEPRVLDLATGTAVRLYSVTVSTITRNVTGRIFCAPPTCWADRAGANVDAVAAAMIPRGAIHPTKPRSPEFRSVRSVAAQATSGRATRTRTATRPTVGSIR